MGKGKTSAKVTRPTVTSGTNGEASAKKITGTDLILTFVVFFVIFGCVGYFRGRSIRNRPDRLRKDIVSRLTVGERNGQQILAYRCNDKNEVIWDIDKNALFTERTLATPSQEFTFSPAILNDDTLMTAFLTGGGVASVFTAKEILTIATGRGSASRLMREGHLELIVVALVATVSGYEIGYQIALRMNSDCSDPRFTALLNDPKNWKGDEQTWNGFEKVFWFYWRREIENEERPGRCQSRDANVRDLEDKKFNLGKAEFLTFINGEVTSIGHDISSTDFTALWKYRDLVREFNQTCRN